jgi:hypothetical protein
MHNADYTAAEGYLRTSTRAEAVKRASEAGQSKVYMGTAVMDGHRLTYDHGDGKTGPYNLPSAPQSPTALTAALDDMNINSDSSTASPVDSEAGDPKRKKLSRRGLLARDLRRWMLKREARERAERREMEILGRREMLARRRLREWEWELVPRPVVASM